MRQRLASCSSNLLATLRGRELASVGKSIAADSGLTYRETHDCESVRGVYRRSIDLASGRFPGGCIGTGIRSPN
jgi:hypothetical protein